MRSWLVIPMGAAVAVLAVAALFVSLELDTSSWALDITGVWCEPHSLLQGHALWHTLTAAAGGLVFGYYRGEMPRLRS